MAKKGMSGHESVIMIKDEWLTPPDIINKLGPFDLDPCSPINRPWDTAYKHFTIEDNGLLQDWQGYVWCNPPYGKYLDDWMHRMAFHNNGIAMIFARTETKTFFKYIWDHAVSILFLKGRVMFYNVDGSKGKGNAGAPSVLIAYGEKADIHLKNSNIKGKYIKLK